MDYAHTLAIPHSHTHTRTHTHAHTHTHTEPNLVTCCLDCCLACASSALRFFNVWAYAVVARDGCSYVSAAKRTFRLWTNHGLSILVNDDITSATLSSFLLLIALLTGAAAAGGAWLWIDGSADDAGVVFMAFFIGFLVGLVEAAVFLEVIYAGTPALWCHRSDGKGVGGGVGLSFWPQAKKSQVGRS